jgi:hypothetical protein
MLCIIFIALRLVFSLKLDLFAIFAMHFIGSINGILMSNSFTSSLYCRETAFRFILVIVVMSLCHEIDPLVFLFIEACDSALSRIYNITMTAHSGNLGVKYNALSHKGYTLNRQSIGSWCLLQY